MSTVITSYTSWAEVAGELEGRLLELARAYRRAERLAAADRRSQENGPRVARDLAAEQAMVHRWGVELGKPGRELAATLVRMVYSPDEPGGTPTAVAPRDLP
jgi:hypothetical protein